MFWTISDFRAPADLIRRCHSAGLWREHGPVGDLRRWATEQPDATAIIQYRDGAEAERLTYGQSAGRVERFAAALHSLGVRAGDVVAVWLPNFWQVNALMLACARIGAVTAPILPTIRTRELERMFARPAPKVCVTVDEWAGFGHAEALDGLAVEHRVVIGRAQGAQIDFHHYFERTPWEATHRMDLADADSDPDRLAPVLFTSGTSSEPKGVLHSFNTIYAGNSPIAEAEDRAGRRHVHPHALTYIGGTLYGITMPLLTGAARCCWTNGTARPGCACCGKPARPSCSRRRRSSVLSWTRYAVPERSRKRCDWLSPGPRRCRSRSCGRCRRRSVCRCARCGG
jgi:cyclohexanecarboxylate-CoA ligase